MDIEDLKSWQGRIEYVLNAKYHCYNCREEEERPFRYELSEFAIEQLIPFTISLLESGYRFPWDDPIRISSDP